MKALTIATEGFLGDNSPLSVAARGLLYIVGVEDVLVYYGGGGAPIRYQIPERLSKIDRKIHDDDEEVAEILIQLIVTGALN